MPTGGRFQPQLLLLEQRDLPALAFPLYPVVPDLSGAVLENIRAIYARGQELGRRPDVFATLGDSISAQEPFLTQLGSPFYNPADPIVVGPYTSLADTIIYYRSSLLPDGSNSFTRPDGTGATGGFTTVTLEAVLPAELVFTNASVALILIGTNDIINIGRPDLYALRLRQIVAACAAWGVVPILNTIPDNDLFGGVYLSDVLFTNQIIANIAEELNVPLINFWSALQALPGRGLDDSLFHPNAHPAGGGYFDGDGLSFGYNVRNLLTVATLDRFRRLVVDEFTLTAWTALPVGGSYVAVASGSYGSVVRVVDVVTGAGHEHIPSLRSDLRGRGESCHR